MCRSKSHPTRTRAVGCALAYTDSWMVANAQCRWLQQWKNWQGRGKPTWAAALWPDTTAQVENVTLKGHDTDAQKLRH